MKYSDSHYMTIGGVLKIIRQVLKKEQENPIVLVDNLILQI